MKKAVAAGVLCAAVACAQNFPLLDFTTYKVNASEIASGAYQQVNWIAEKNTPIVLGGTTVRTSTLSTAWHDRAPIQPLGGFNFFRPVSYAGPTWPPAWDSALLQPAPVEAAKPTPAQATQNGYTFEYTMAFFQRGAVDFPSPARVDARASDGYANASVNYRIEVVNTGNGAKDYFLAFPVPKLKRTVVTAYSLSSSSDSNGGTYTDIYQNEARSRSTIDVYADGLPVFQSASFYEYPKNYDDSSLYKIGDGGDPTLHHWPWDNVQTAFNDLFVFNTVKIYLGKLNSQDKVVLDVVLRGDAFADAPQCGTSSAGSYPPTIDYHCFSLDETVSIPAKNNQVAFQVYAKHL